MIIHPKQISQKAKIIAQIIICLFLLGVAVYISVPAHAQSESLRMARVSAPNINCIFDQDCEITVSDSSADIEFFNTEGAGFLQSRILPQGESDTAAEGLYGYEYRIDLREISAVSERPCILSMRVNFGPLVPIDYDDDGAQEDFYVVVEGGIGTVIPERATQVGDLVTVDFGNGICVGDPIEGISGESTVFIGFTSRRPNRIATAEIRTTTEEGTLDLEIRTPLLGCERILSPDELPDASLITFEELANAATIGDSYRAEFGVRFEESETNNAIIYGNEPDGAASSPNTVSNSAVFPNTSEGVPLLIEFDTPQTDVGFYIGNGDSDTVNGLLTAFNAEGKPICRLAYPRVPDAHTMFAGIHNPDGQIAAITLDYGGTLRSESIDDLYFVAASQPDLIVESLTVDSLNADKVAYSYVIKNIGDAPIDLEGPTDSLADDVSVQAFLSQDEIFNNAGDSPIGGRILGAGILAPTESFSGTFSATPQAGVDPATFAYLTLMVDWGEAALESNEENNAIATPIDVPQPDLIVESLAITEILSNSIAYSYTIKNIGDAPVDLEGPTDSPNDNVAVQAFLSQDMIFNNEGDSAAGGTNVGGGTLASGETLSGQFGATTQAGADPATFAYLTMMVDGREAVVESNEENNTIATPIAGPKRLRVCREENNECVGQPDALLYNLATHRSLTATMPLDENGYALAPVGGARGDSFWAMQVVSQTGPLADVGSATLYHTSGLMPTTVLSDTFENDNVLHLYISDEHPLLVRDLAVSAQWVPAEDETYRVQLTENLTKTSNFLHDFTDGQFALGNITVYQHFDKWNESDVRLYANNNLRPLAVVGGIVEDVTPDVSPAISLTYASGAIYLGSQWNRYFEPPNDKDIPDEEKEKIKDDWALAFGHELGHYALFLWDTYFGIVDVPPTGDEEPADKPKKKVEEVDGCIGSAMGYLYDFENTEFIFDSAHWMTNCSTTHAYSQTNGLRTEWDTIQAWYPWSIQPTQVMTNTPPPPIDLTTINFNPPSNPVTTLFTQTFDLLYESPVVTQTIGASDRARSYIIRNDRIIEQGQPPEASRVITLTGAAEGDRLCLFDIKNVAINNDGKFLLGDNVDPDTTLRHQFGCKVLDAAENEEYELDLERDVSWEPVIEIDYADEPPDPPESEDEVTIRVALDGGPLNLMARIYPEHEDTPTETEIFAHDPISNTYSTTVTLPKFTPSIYVQLWATDDDGNVTETTPRREAIVGSGVKGAVFPGPARIAGGAPIITPDGDFVVFFNEAINLGVGEFIAIQETYAIPPLPTNTIPFNNVTGYRLTARPSSLITDGIVSLRYLPPPSDGPLSAASIADEQLDLTIYHWDGDSWNPLKTTSASEPNGYMLASAPIDEGGIYALLENVIPGFKQAAYLPFIVNE